MEKCRSIPDEPQTSHPLALAPEFAVNAVSCQIHLVTVDPVVLAIQWRQWLCVPKLKDFCGETLCDWGDARTHLLVSCTQNLVYSCI